jgi:hypothetical protein
VVGNEKQGLSVMFVLKMPSVPEVHGTPVTYEVALCPLG